MTDTQGESLQSETHQIAVERGRASAEIAKAVDATFNRKGGIAESVTKIQAVITVGRTVELRKFAVTPVVAASVNDNSTHRRTVAVNPFCGGIHHDIRPPVERIAQVASGAESIVDNKRDIRFAGYFRDPFNIRYSTSGISHRLYEYRLGVPVAERCDCRRSFIRGNTDLDSEFPQGVTEKIVSTSVKERRGHNIVSCLGQRRDDDKDSRHTGRSSHGSGSSVKRSDSFLVGRSGRILKTGINVAWLREFEEVSGVSAGREPVGGRRHNSQSAGISRVSGMETSVDLACGKSQSVFLLHYKKELKNPAPRDRDAGFEKLIL